MHKAKHIYMPSCVKRLSTHNYHRNNKIVQQKRWFIKSDGRSKKLQLKTWVHLILFLLTYLETFSNGSLVKFVMSIFFPSAITSKFYATSTSLSQTIDQIATQYNNFQPIRDAKPLRWWICFHIYTQKKMIEVRSFSWRTEEFRHVKINFNPREFIAG